MKRSAIALLVACSPWAGVAHAATNSVYYAEFGFGNTVTRFDPSPDVTTASDVDLVTTVGHRALAVDTLNSRLYYGNGNAIWSANLDGSGASELLATSAGVGDIEVDPTNAKLYFSEAGAFDSERAIFSVNTDGSSLTTLHDMTTTAGSPGVTTFDVFNIELDLTNSRLYWTADNGDVSNKVGLNSSALTGGAVTQHFVGGGSASSIDKMDIDFDNSTVYYTVGSSTSAVRTSGIDGSGVTTLASSVGTPNAIVLDKDNDLVYFSTTDKIHQVDLDGTDLLSSDAISGNAGYNIFDMELGPVPEPSSLALLALGGLAFARRRR